MINEARKNVYIMFFTAYLVARDFINTKTEIRPSWKIEINKPEEEQPDPEQEKETHMPSPGVACPRQQVEDTPTHPVLVSPSGQALLW